MQLKNLQQVVDYVNNGTPNHGPWLVHHLRRQASILELSSAIGLDIPGYWLPFLAEGRKVGEVQSAERTAIQNDGYASSSSHMERKMSEVFVRWDEQDAECKADENND